MSKCKVCSSTNFYKEAGYFFCQTCQTQNEEIREEVFELRVDSSTRLRKTKIRQLRSDISGGELGWTTWELYNFILIGLTNELIELGVPSDIKITILQLWATYLRKIEVAFISTKKKSMPKLARRFNKRDAEIIYGKAQLQKRCRKRKRSSTNTSMISSYQSEGSSARELNKNKKLLINADYDRYLQSQASSDPDSSMLSQSVHSGQSSSVKSSDYDGKVKFSSHAKLEAQKIKRLSKNVSRCKRAKYKAAHVSTQYKIGPHVITPMKLWAIVYLALRIHNQPVQLGDMLRYGREGHLSYYKLDHLLPPEVRSYKIGKNFLSQNVEITHKSMRQVTASMAKFLGVWNVVCPDFFPLINRYCQELGLPSGIQMYTERLIALSHPKMIFNSQKSHIPNYEGRAIAFIIVVLKTLLALDGLTEYEISRLAEKINSVASDRNLLHAKLFSFNEWQRYIECRKTILAHAHFPTKVKYDPEAIGVDDLYIKFSEHISSKSEKREGDTGNSKHDLPDELIEAMTKHISNLSINDVPAKTVEVFSPSLTPLRSYLQYLLDDTHLDVPNILRSDFSLTKVGYITKPDLLIKLAVQCDIELEVIDSSLHFLDKVVPPFEQPRMPSIKKLQELIDVQDDAEDHGVDGESLNDYLHAKVPCKIILDVTKEQYYNSIKSRTKNVKNVSAEYEFSFTETLPNGKLAIPEDSDSEDEGEQKESDINSSVNQGSLLLNDQFCDKYNLCLSLAEKEDVRKVTMDKKLNFKKPMLRRNRNAKGQFIKDGTVSVQVSNEVVSNNFGVNSSIKLDTTNDEMHISKSIEVDDINDTSKVETSFSSVSNIFNLTNLSVLYEDEDVLAVVNEMTSKDIEKYRFFRPFKEYWMYHCIFSRVKPKNFAVFESSLPRTFRWLLNECAHIVEMTTEDLYEEVCLIEDYHAHVLKSLETDSSSDTNSISKQQLNLILNRW